MKKLRKNLATVVVITALFILPLRAAEDQKDTVDETPSVVIAVAPTYPPIALARISQRLMPQSSWIW
jgi:hypothetical protein